jgi:ubiquinone/menaquinone biosynthesis C-methylase UbiE
VSEPAPLPVGEETDLPVGEETDLPVGEETDLPVGEETDLPVGEEKVVAVRSMFDAVAPRYDLVNRIMTFGLDVRWRRRALRDLRLPPRTRVLDLASGTGDFCRELDTAGINAIGLDLSLGMLQNARTGVPLAQADVLRLPVPDGSVDGVTCGFALRNLVALPPFFTELARVVRPGGRIAHRVNVLCCMILHHRIRQNHIRHRYHNRIRRHPTKSGQLLRQKLHVPLLPYLQKINLRRQAGD